MDNMFDRDRDITATLRKKGFTLLELLIVIGIIAILSVVLILVLNPAETLKKSRDTQRLSDLSTLKTALGLYITSTTTPDLDGTGGMACLSGTNFTGQIAYSYPSSSAVGCTPDVSEGGDTSATFSSSDFCYHVTSATISKITGSGWIPVNLGTLIGGSPISNLPVDPTNSIASPASPVVTDLVYRYTCQDGSPASGKPANVFELNARLESTTYGPGGGDDKSANDGGDLPGMYEVGSSLFLMGSSSNF